MEQHKLTKREINTLDLLSNGYCAKSIARIQQCAAPTVRKRINTIFYKLSAINAVHAVSIAIRGGLIAIVICIAIDPYHHPRRPTRPIRTVVARIQRDEACA